MFKEKLKVLQTIHLAFCTAVFLFIVVVLLLQNSQGIQSNVDLGVYQFIIPVLLVAAFVASFIIRKKYISNALETRDKKEKITTITSGFIMEMAPLEGSALFLIVVSFLTSNTEILLIAAAVLATMVFRRPTKDRLITTFGFSENDF